MRHSAELLPPHHLAGLGPLCCSPVWQQQCGPRFTPQEPGKNCEFPPFSSGIFLFPTPATSCQNHTPSSDMAGMESNSARNSTPFFSFTQDSACIFDEHLQILKNLLITADSFSEHLREKIIISWFCLLCSMRHSTSGVLFVCWILYGEIIEKIFAT